MIRAMHNLKSQGKTVILVSHRRSALAEADRILVLEKGKLTQETQLNKSQMIHE
jgi:ABC-type bacteriocin/lantibiotic exporter with double-glycine peptidase domain